MNQKVPNLLPLFLAFVLLIGFLALGKWYVSGQELNQLLHERNILNISGRQRTYSQEVTKYALELHPFSADTMTNEQVQKIVSEFDKIITNWSKDYLLLVNHEQNSAQMQKLFGKQEKYYQILFKNSRFLISAYQAQNVQTEAIKSAIEQILAHEVHFLRTADEITRFYIVQSSNHRFHRNEILFLGLFLILVILGAGLMYFFANRIIKRSFGKLAEQNNALKLQEQSLLASEEELRQQTEELRTINDKLTENQQELSENIQFQEALLKSAGVMIISTDTEGMITGFNPLAEELLGYQAEELVGKQTPAVFHDLEEVVEVAAELSEKYQTVIEPGFEVFAYPSREFGVIFEREWTYIAKNGRKFPVNLTISAIKDAQNETIAYLGIASDISEQKRIEAEKEGFLKDLSQSKEFLSKALFDLRTRQVELQRLSWVAKHTTNAVIISDKNGMIEWVNEGFTKITGYKPEEVIGKKPGRILQGKDTDPETVALLRQKIADAQPVNVDILNYTKDQRPYWLNLDITPIFSKRNTLTNFIAIESDITQRILEKEYLANMVEKLNTSQEELKQQTEEIKATNSKLMEQEAELAKALTRQEQLWNALNQSSLVSITNLKGEILEANERFCQVSGYAIEELKGQNHSIINSGYHPKQFWKEMWQIIGRGDTWRGEICNRSKSGELYWVYSVINPILNTEGKIYRYLSIRNVITERKKLEQQVRRDSKSLERKNKVILANQILLEEKNKAISDSINYASRIQKAMLPDTAEYQLFMPEHFVFYKPRDVISGDFYWFSKKEDHIVIAVADCTGHGVPGAMMSMIGNELFYLFIQVLGISAPESILDEVNKAVRRTLRQSQNKNRDGMEVSLCIINTKTKKLEFAGAKSPLIYIQNNELKRLRGSKFPVGGYSGTEQMVYHTHTVKIDVPTHIYMYSDGFQDQFGGKDGQKYMSVNFRHLLHRIHQEPLEKQALMLELELAEWRGKSKQVDDILVVGIKLDLTEKDSNDYPKNHNTEKDSK